MMGSSLVWQKTKAEIIDRKLQRNQISIREFLPSEWVTADAVRQEISRLPKHRQGFVYLVVADEVARCKIGYSSDPERRFQALNLMSPVELRLEKYIRGSMNIETCLHLLFRDHYVKGEWFEYVEPIVEFFRETPSAGPK